MSTTTDTIVTIKTRSPEAERRARADDALREAGKVRLNIWVSAAHAKVLDAATRTAGILGEDKSAAMEQAIEWLAARAEGIEADHFEALEHLVDGHPDSESRLESAKRAIAEITSLDFGDEPKEFARHRRFVADLAAKREAMAAKELA